MVAVLLRLRGHPSCSSAGDPRLPDLEKHPKTTRLADVQLLLAGRLLDGTSFPSRKSGFWNGNLKGFPFPSSDVSLFESQRPISLGVQIPKQSIVTPRRKKWYQIKA